MFNKDDKWIERIKCPYCGKIQDAIVDFEEWMPARCHECEECHEYIMESEWFVVSRRSIYCEVKKKIRMYHI